MDLKELNRDDLIRIIGTMHDTIKDWDDGYGLPEGDVELLNDIGEQSVSFCIKNGWEISKK